MKLILKQRFFSWFDSYNIYNEHGETMFRVEGQISWGHCLHIADQNGCHIGTVKERVFAFLPKFELYIGETYAGCIAKRLTFLRAKYDIECNGWQVSGDLFGWDYRIMDPAGETVAAITKELFNLTDTYVIDVKKPEDALLALMMVLAIDAEKCSG